MERDEAISTLQAYAFIVDRGTLDRFDIHRLVRLATLNWVQAQGETIFEDAGWDAGNASADRPMGLSR